MELVELKQQSDNNILLIIILIISFMFGFLGIVFLIITFPAYFYYKHKYKKKNAKFDKIDIKYFRDDLGKISPAYISFIQDFDIELEKDVSAHILKLYIDGYVKLEDNKFVVTDKDQTNMKKSDIILLDFVKDNFNNPYFLVEYKKQIINELIEDDYIKDKTKKSAYRKYIKWFFYVFLIITFAQSFAPHIFGVTNLIHNERVLKYIFIIEFLVIILVFLGFIFVIPLIIAKKFASVKYDKYVRTDKGNELLEKVYGLRNFLNDFSNIKDRKFDDIYLQQHYLVYALILNINTTVDNEIIKKINNQINNH